MHPRIQDTPEAIVENDIVHCGFFKTPFKRVNLLDAPNLHARPLRWFRLKEWVGFGIFHPRLCGAVIIQDAKYAASGTVYLYDRETRRKYEWLAIGMPWKVKLPETLWDGGCSCTSGGGGISFDHNLSGFRHSVRAGFKARGDIPQLELDLVFHQDLRTTDPLVVSLPIPPGHHTYTHKSPLHIEGIIRLGGDVFSFDPASDRGSLDEQKTFYPYHSHWYWGSFAGRSEEGRELAINLVNQMTPAGEPGEDAMWVDGRLMLLDQAAFIPGEARGSFRIEDREGRVRLRFAAVGSKIEKRNLLAAAIDYEQFFGTYDGELVGENGGIHTVKGVFGVLERMDARF
jgi:hypothetical protein